MSFTQGNLNPPTPLKKTLDFRIKYKTQKCRYWLQKGFCPFNLTCAFAHFDQQIRDKIYQPSKYKTKTCINFSDKGYCKYGDRCQYIHRDVVKEPCQDGRKTRSNSEDSSSSSTQGKILLLNSTKLINTLTHHKRIELIKTLGSDYTIRTNSRLMQLLKSNEHQMEENDCGCQCIEEVDVGKVLEIYWFDTV